MRLMMGGIMDGLHALGWKIVINSDLYDSVDLCFWMFHKETPNNDPSFSVALSAKSKLLVSNAPDDVAEVIKKTCQEVQKH